VNTLAQLFAGRFRFVALILVAFLAFNTLLRLGLLAFNGDRSLLSPMHLLPIMSIGFLSASPPPAGGCRSSRSLPHFGPTVRVRATGPHGLPARGALGNYAWKHRSGVRERAQVPQSPDRSVVRPQTRLKKIGWLRRCALA
jgi:hypothetical protein